MNIRNFITKGLKLTALMLASILFAGMILPVAAESTQVKQKSNKQLAVDIAAEGTVLLENNGALPLEATPGIALLGVNQSGTFFAGGGGSGGSNTTDITTTLQAFRAAEREGKLSLYAPLVDYYTDLTSETVPSASMLAGAVEFTDTAVVCIGRWSEEGVDLKAAAGGYYLTANEKELLSTATACFDRVIVCMNICAVMDLSFVKEYDVDALLVNWMPGQYGAAALPSVLLGEINPSGKLVDTFADSYDAYPSAANFGGTFVEYEEDIFVGYRYFETFDEAYDRVLYPFGYGLSYTKFDLTDISVVSDVQKDIVRVDVTVTNVGAVAGKEVVQVYFGHPEDNVLGYPAKELAAFEKTKLLAPGESQSLRLTYKLSDMAGYDDTGKIQSSAYILEAGDYPIYVGNSVRNVAVAATVTIDKTTVTQQLSECGVNVMQLSRRLLADGSYEKLAQREPETENSREGVTLIAATGTTVFETESYYKVEGNTSLAVSNGALHNTHFGGKLYYHIEVEEYGEYSVWVNTAQGANTGNDCLKVYVDGELQRDFRVDMKQTTGGWEQYTYIPAGTLELEEGEHELVIDLGGGIIGNMESWRICGELDEDEERFDLDSVDTDKPVYAEGSSIIQAEHYDATTIPLTNTNGILEGLHLEGTLTYIVYAEATADYLLSVRAACGNDGADNAMTVMVNDQLQSHAVLSTKGGTGGWLTAKDMSAGYITLKAGKNEIVIDPNSFNFDRMTLTRLPGAPVTPFEDRDPVAEEDILDFKEVYADPSKMDAFLEQLTTSELMLLVAGKLPASNWGDLTRYGVPAGTASDGPAGLRNGTYWPVAVTQACTWNTELIAEMGLRIGQEAYELGVDIWLAPALNIHRNPLCGRNFEYYSEDPLISGCMAAAVVTGCQAQGVAVTLKHLAGNNCEENRNTTDSRMSERALREIYLEGFRVAVERSDPWAIMTSYNRINGCEVSESYDILTTIVRGEWGYEGLIMSDWWNDSNEAAEILAGNNLKMPEGSTADLIAALNAGALTRDDLKTSAEYVLELMFHIDRLKAIFDPDFTHTVATEPRVPQSPAPDEPPAVDPTPDDDGDEGGEDDVTPPDTSVDKKGCASALSLGGGGAVLLTGAAAVAATRKKKHK